jgi:DNA topoisomerase III
MQLDAVVTGRADFRAVIDGIAAEAETLIAALRQRPKGAVDLQAAPPTAPGNKRPGRKPRGSAKAVSEAKVARKPASAKPKRARKPKPANPVSQRAAPSASPRSPAPTERMVSYAEKLAKAKGVALPAGFNTDLQAPRRFLDQHG